MKKRLSIDIKKKILELVKSNTLTFAQLERKVNTGYRTIKSNCEELKDFGLLELKKEIHPTNGQNSNIVKITKRGIEYLKN